MLQLDALLNRADVALGAGGGKRSFAILFHKEVFCSLKIFVHLLIDTKSSIH
jgi:hypothetical protein